MRKFVQASRMRRKYGLCMDRIRWRDSWQQATSAQGYAVVVVFVEWKGDNSAMRLEKGPAVVRGRASGTF